MSDKPPKDEEKERRKLEKRKKEQERREKEMRKREKKEQKNTLANNQKEQEEENPTSTSNTTNKLKKRKRVYYSAVSASEDDDTKFTDAKSSSEDFRDSMSRTDNEVERLVPQPSVKPQSAPSKPLSPIPEEMDSMDAQPETSQAIRKKKKQTEQDITIEKDIERTGIEAPEKKEGKSSKTPEGKSPGKTPKEMPPEQPIDKSWETSSEKVSVTPKVKKEKSSEMPEEMAPEKSIEKPPQKLPETIDQEIEVTKEIPKKKKSVRNSDDQPQKSNDSPEAQEKHLDNDGNEREKTRAHTKDKTSEKEPLPIVIPQVATAPPAASSEQITIDSNDRQTGKTLSELDKFKQLSDDFLLDSDEYEMYLEKMKAKSKNMSKTTGTPKKPADPFPYAETASLERGGAFVYMVIPPDGGYGWLVLVVSFLCQVIVDGIVLSLGIVLPFIAEDMGSSPSATSLVASTQIGPITSAFINKYGFRPVALFGGTMAICTILLSTLSTNLPTLIIFYSIFGGMSLSMIWSSSQLIVGYYFEKYRPIASGVSCSGAGAGVLMFSYMNSQLAPQVGWRNTSRIHVAFLFFVLLIVLVYIEVVPTRIGRMLDHNLPDSETDSDESGFHTFMYSRITLHSVATSTLHSKSVHGNLLVHYESTKLKEAKWLNKCFQKCCPPFRRFMVERRRMSDEEKGSKRIVIRQDPLERQDIYYTGATDYEEYKPKDIIELLDENESGVEIEILPSNKTQSVHYNLATRQESLPKVRTTPPSAYSMDRKRSNAFLDFISPSNWMHPKIKRGFNILFDLRLLAVMEFQVLLASAFFFPMGFNIPFVYSKVRAELDPIYSDLISPAIGLSNFFFRIASGVVAFKFRRYTTNICGYGIVFGGSVTLLSAVFGKDIVWFQFLFAICFGVAPAFYSTLRAIIYVQMLGLDKLTNAFGLTAMAMGAGVFIGTYTGGLLIEKTGGYVATFAFSGACMILAGSLKLLLPTLVSWRNNRKIRRRFRLRNSRPR